jgi:hypothetical protein
MIKLLESGDYRLIETKGQTKILILPAATYAWVNAKDIGEILVASHNPHQVDHLLAVGEYRLYDVDDEPHLSDQLHLELAVGRAEWQGYLLTTGFPTDEHKRGRIIPTREVISAT